MRFMRYIKRLVEDDLVARIRVFQRYGKKV